MARPIFYSFHYNNDVFRVQQIRNIGSLEDNKPVSHNAWEAIKSSGPKAIQNWIDDNMKYRQCVVVLVGEETASRAWVKYEIEKAWNDGRGLFGIYIHNLKDPRNSNTSPYYGKSKKGANPFDQIPSGGNFSKLSSFIRCYDPSPTDTYNDIVRNLESWVEKAINDRK